MQDLTGVPAVVDLAAMREAMRALGGDAGKINPLVPAELVIDHSVIADVFGRPDAFDRNVELEFHRNRERFAFLRWGQEALRQFKVVPPGTGIVHQVNIEYLARVVMTSRPTACSPPTPTPASALTRTPPCRTAWASSAGASAASRPRPPCSASRSRMLIPRVVGFRLTGELPAGATATDLVLTITELLRKHGVVGKFVEFYGDGVAAVPVANRATIGNMSPEFGSTCAIFPIDERDPDLPAAHRPSGRAGRAGRGLRQGAGPVARPGRARPLLRGTPARPVHGGAVAGRPEAAAGPGGAGRREDRVPRRRSAATCSSTSWTTRSRARSRRPTRSSRPRERRRRRPAAAGVAQAAVRTANVTLDDGTDDLGRPRLGGDRRDHLLHQHLEPVGDDRRRAGGQEGGRGRPGAQALGEDHAGARLQGSHGLLRARRPDSRTWRSSASTWSATAAPPASATPARCPRRSARRSPRTTSPSSRCCPATGTSRAGSTRTSR